MVKKDLESVGIDILGIELTDSEDWEPVPVELDKRLSTLLNLLGNRFIGHQPDSTSRVKRPDTQLSKQIT